MTRPPDPPRKRRWWPCLAAAVAGVVGLLAGGIALDRYLARKAWADACAEADRLDPGWRWDDLTAARPVGPADNVAARIRDVKAALPQQWPNWAAAVRPEDVPPPPPPMPGDDVPPLGVVVDVDSPEARRGMFARELEMNLDTLTPAQQLRAIELAAVRAVLAQAGDALPKTADLEDLPAGRVPVTEPSPLLFRVPLDHVQHTRAVARLLQLDATVQAAGGHIDAALADARRILASARATDAEPCLIAGLVGVAVRIVGVTTVERTLAQGEPGPDALDRTRRAVQGEMARPLALAMLRGERALWDDYVRCVEDGRVSRDDADEIMGLDRMTGNGRLDRWLGRIRGRGWSLRKAAAYLRRQTRLVEAVKDSPDGSEVRDAVAAATSDPNLALQAFDRVLAAERRSRALLAAADAALAAERFRRDRGRWPASIKMSWSVRSCSRPCRPTRSTANRCG
jgi:hypothetical protein